MMGATRRLRAGAYDWDSSKVSVARRCARCMVSYLTSFSLFPSATRALKETESDGGAAVGEGSSSKSTMPDSMGRPPLRAGIDGALMPRSVTDDRGKEWHLTA